MERVTELVRLGLVQPLAVASRLWHGVVAQAVLLQLLVDLGEGALADHARAAWGQLPLVALAADVAGLLQHLEQLLQLLELLGGVIAQEVAELVQVHVLQVARVLGALQVALHVVDVVHLRHQLHRLLQADFLVAAERVGGWVALVRVHEVQVLRQFGEFRLQFRVAEAVREQALQRIALVTGHRLHQRLHRLHLRLHLIDQFVERLRRVVAEHVAELVHEGLEVRLLPAHLLREHVVERLHHVLHPLDVALGHLLDHLLDVLEELVGHGLAELIHQLLELVLCLRVQELVVLELLHLAGGVLREAVQEVLLALRDALEHLLELLLRGLLPTAGLALLARLTGLAAIAGLARLRAARGLSGLWR